MSLFNVLKIARENYNLNQNEVFSLVAVFDDYYWSTNYTDVIAQIDHILYQ